MHLTRRQLLQSGWTDGRIARAVRDGRLTRIRAGHFADRPIDEQTRRAVRVGGRLACVSELRHRGIWVLDSEPVHVHLAANAARLRPDPCDSRGHWRPLVEPAVGDPDHVSLVDALLQARDCLGRHEWLASVDSALHLRLLQPRDRELLRAALRCRYRSELDVADQRAESGLESIVRLVALDLGFRVRSQVTFPGIGRVDLLVEDWVAVETDGSAFHDLPLAAGDRRRDALLAAAGRTVLRPGYALIVHDRRAVARQLIGAVESHRRVRDSGRLAARARRRLERTGLA